MRLIDTDKLKEILTDYFQIGSDCYTYSLTRCKEAFDIGTMSFDDFREFDEEMIDDIIGYIDAQPTIEAEPVVHGEWVKKFNGVRRNISTNKDEASYKGDCNICGFHTGNWCTTYKYCPMCGAKMEDNDE